jgi:hypothetical protein
MKKNIHIILCISLIAIIASLSIVSADYWKCFNQGEKIKFCNKNANYNRCNNYDICTIDSYQEICIARYNVTAGCYSQGGIGSCNSNPKQCSGSNGSAIDSEPPVLVINSPVNNGVFSSKSVLLNLSMNEMGSIFSYDNLNGRGKWSRICSDCSNYNKPRSFNEGFNDITFRAVDAKGNEAFFNVSFFVDSKKPQIHKTLPESGFANGDFEIQYTEDNVKSIKLVYGNSLSGFKDKTSNQCVSGKKQWCAFDVDLSVYEGEVIEYHFIVEDISGNLKESKKINLEVDNTLPVLNNPGAFSTQGVGINSKYIYFFFNVTEKNFGGIYYSYTDQRGKEIDKSLCKALKNGICSKRESFGRGDHTITVNILDNAGNMISEPVSFTVN